MAQNKKRVKKEENKKAYKNPISSIWGKILIVVLSLAMVGGILFGLISAIISNFGNV
ncbi:MAG: hypothetical protein ACI35W_07030 [Anaeroplasmataceae bacterium]